MGLLRLKRTARFGALALVTVLFFHDGERIFGCKGCKLGRFWEFIITKIYFPLLGWLYLGCLGSDKLPIGVAKLPPEGYSCICCFKRYAKHWMFDLAILG